MEGKIESHEDIERMLEGLTRPQRERVVAGALRDIDADLKLRRARKRELLGRLRSIEHEAPAHDGDATAPRQPREHD